MTQSIAPARGGVAGWFPRLAAVVTLALLAAAPQRAGAAAPEHPGEPADGAPAGEPPLVATALAAEAAGRWPDAERAWRDVMASASGYRRVEARHRRDALREVEESIDARLRGRRGRRRARSLLASATQTFERQRALGWAVPGGLAAEAAANKARKPSLRRRFGGEGLDGLVAIWPRGKGRWLVAGTSDVGGADRRQLALWTLDAAGRVLSIGTIGAEGPDVATAATDAVGGDVFIAGWTRGPSDRDAVVVRAAADGTLRWQRTLEEEGHGHALGVVRMAAGLGVLVAQKRDATTTLGWRWLDEQTGELRGARTWQLAIESPRLRDLRELLTRRTRRGWKGPEVVVCGRDAHGRALLVAVAADGSPSTLWQARDGGPQRLDAAIPGRRGALVLVGAAADGQLWFGTRDRSNRISVPRRKRWPKLAEAQVMDVVGRPRGVTLLVQSAAAGDDKPTTSWRVEVRSPSRVGRPERLGVAGDRGRALTAAGRRRLVAVGQTNGGAKPDAWWFLTEP